MCILIHHYAYTNFTDEHLADFYSRNSDGFGAMVNKDGKVEVIKTIGDLNEIKSIYASEIKGHEAVLHFRMRTHGDIDLFNCHPYQITESIWLSHNGILSTGNSADQTKSDTWHYIQNYLRPLLAKSPKLLHEPAFQKLVASHIGYSNKFGFMDGDGKIVIINRDSGVVHLDAWLSNTYAWSPAKWGFYTTPVTQTYRHNGYGGYTAYGKTYGLYDDDYDWGSYHKPGSTAKSKEVGGATPKKTKWERLEEKRIERLGKLSSEALGNILRKTYNVMQRNPYNGLVDWVIENPMKAMHLIYEFYQKSMDPQEVSDIVNADPDEAAAIIETMWDECQEDCMALARIPFVPKGEKDEQHIQ